MGEYSQPKPEYEVILKSVNLKKIGLEKKSQCWSQKMWSKKSLGI